jgi:hypothetical protein
LAWGGKRRFWTPFPEFLGICGKIIKGMSIWAHSKSRLGDDR